MSPLLVLTDDHLRRMNPLVEAQRLLKLGYSVIPLHPRGKEPLFPWGEFQKRRATPQELVSWWQDCPDANLGVVTGAISDLLVVDVDTERGGLLDHALELGPTQRRIRTAHGWHLHYHYPREGRVSNRVGDDGIDVRGEGGLIVMPPSLHADGFYYHYDMQGPRGECPAWVLDIERMRTESDQHWITDVLTRGIERGNRNNTAARLAGYFFSHAFPLDVADGMLQLWNTRNRPPLLPSIVTRTVQSVYATATRRSQPNLDAKLPVLRQETGLIRAKPKDGAYVVDTHFEDEDDSPSRVLAMMSYEQFNLYYAGEEVPWLCEGWFPDGTIAFLVAPPGYYKTWLALDFAISVASGYPFLGRYPMLKQGPVLIYQQEDPPAALAKRMSIIHYQKVYEDQPILTEERLGASQSPVYKINTLADLPIYMHPFKLFSFSDQKALRGLEDSVRELSPILVVIDPLYVAGEDTDSFLAKTATKMRALKALRDYYGTSFLIVHHTRKAPDDKEARRKGEKAEEKADHSRELIWGSQFLNAALETGWQVRPRRTANTISLQRHFKNGQTPLPEVLTFDIQDDAAAGRTYYHVEVQGEAEALAETGEDILDLLRDGSLSLAEIVKALSISRTTANRKLKKLLDEKSIIKAADGRYSVSGVSF